MGYHVTNLAIHVANALLVYWLLQLTFTTPALQNSPLKDRAPLIALITAMFL
jgi:hypothetical protein